MKFNPKLKVKEEKLEELQKLSADLLAKHRRIHEEINKVHSERNKSYIDQYLKWLDAGGRDKFKIGDKVQVVRNHGDYSYSMTPPDYIELCGTVIDIVGNTLRINVRTTGEELARFQTCSYAEVELDYNLYKEDFDDYVQNYSVKGIQGWLG